MCPCKHCLLEKCVWFKSTRHIVSQRQKIRLGDALLKAKNPSYNAFLIQNLWRHSTPFPSPRKECQAQTLSVSLWFSVKGLPELVASMIFCVYCIFSTTYQWCYYSNFNTYLPLCQPMFTICPVAPHLLSLARLQTR